LFVTISAALTLLISAALIIAAAHSQGISTAAWTSSDGMQAGLLFFSNEVLCLVGISLLGMLIAVLTRSTGTAVGIALAYVRIPEGLIAMVSRDGAESVADPALTFLPRSIVTAASRPTPPPRPTPL